MNLRPSGYEPDELPGCSTPRQFFIHSRDLTLFSRFGGDLLSRVLRRSTIGVGALNGRVRDGIGCFASAMTTKPRKKRSSARRVRFARVRSHGLCLAAQLVVIDPDFCGLVSIVPSRCQLHAMLVQLLCAIDCPGAGRRVRDVTHLLVLLLLDQIKPIEQLVPVS